jgi:hypothetical protein
MWNRLIVIAGAVAVLVVVPVVVLAATSGGGSPLDHQRFAWRTGDITTTSTTLHNVPGLSALVCARGAVSAAVSVTAEGAPFALTVRLDDGPQLRPGTVQFTGGRNDSKAYTWVGGVGPFEANDNHAFAVQWKSVTGGPVTIHKATFDLLYKRGTQC